MTEDDRRHWDRRYADGGPAPSDDRDPPPAFTPHIDLLPTTGVALELACGRGRAAVWMARRGLRVHGVDVSPVAIGLARDLANDAGVGDACTFDVVDLDDGLPEGPPVDVVLCHFFRDERLDRAIVARLARGGVVAMAVLSEVGSGPGPFRAAPGELLEAFSALDVLAHEEADGTAVIVARAP